MNNENEIKLHIDPTILDALVPHDVEFKNDEVRKFLLDSISNDVENILNILKQIGDNKINVNELRNILSTKGYHFCF